MTVERERALADAAQLLARRVGLRLDPSMRGRLSRSVEAEAADVGLDIATYVARLDTDATVLQGLLNRVTVQETSFFRDSAQFDALATHVLPGLDGPLTIWSAGCANGQEPYSIAMLLDEHGYTDARVIATDISTQGLDRARKGRYSARETAGLSPERRERALVRIEDQFEIVPELRARVEVAFQNLATDAPPFAPEACSVVFCRNVLIYFSHDEVVRVLDRIADWLPPGGWLFLGYSESLWQVTDRFQMVRLGDAFVFHCRDAAPTRAPRVLARALRTERPSLEPDQHKRAAHITRTRPLETASAPLSPSPAAQIAALLADGEAAVGAGEYAIAVAAFRKSIYLDPGQPHLHLHLGLALEASGDPVAARRAFAAARAALDGCDVDTIEAVLEGYRVAELALLLDRKLVEAE